MARTGRCFCCLRTDSGWSNANSIKLTQLGKKLVAPEEEGEDLAARREAILKPRILREFFERYRRAKLPNDTIAANVLKSLSLPPDRVQDALEIIKSNGRYAGIIRETPTGPFVNLDSPGVPAPTATPELPEQDIPTLNTVAPGAEGGSQPLTATPDSTEHSVPPPSAPAFDIKINRIFISHGKQRAIVGQIKELLDFGRFEPVVSVERESTAIPVPEKVFEDMRSCGAGVIHVGGEGKYLDKDGNEHTKLNENVLIEIGAAMALYGKKDSPCRTGRCSAVNLQVLYRCEFEGDRLDYEATMKLLKTFSQFR
jgi:Predicted nucleotide-binding protein containing TIR-like domain